jgi:hypothetical protein
MKAPFSRRPGISIVAAGCVAAAIAIAAILTSARGKASETIPQSHCQTSQSCIDVVNVGPGEAIRGVAHNNSGIDGATRASSAHRGEENINAGVRGMDTSPQVGPENFSTGLLGFSQTGFGMSGFAKIHAGVYGQTTNPSFTDLYGTAGVEGFDQSNDTGQLNLGVEGGTFAGTGVFGFSTLGNGVRGITTNPSSMNQLHRAAVFGIDESTDGGGLDFGVAGFSPGTGVAGISIAPPTAPGAPLEPAVAAYCENGGAAIQAADGFSSTSNLLMTLDCSGNLTVKGTVVSGGIQVASAKTQRGVDVAEYAPRQTEPTIEDFGEAQLIAGRAHIEIRADFAATIDRGSRYLVFITPEGDNRGLYVIDKATNGFDVRESQDGQSNIAFSYRIVATPFGVRDERLPLMSEVRAREAGTNHRSGVRPGDVLRSLGANTSAPSITSPHV